VEDAMLTLRNRNRSALWEVALRHTSSVWNRIARAGLALAVLSATAVSLGACNTTAGLGQDVSATGQAVTKGADKVKQGL
jgi:predicted small secreted protein